MNTQSLRVEFEKARVLPHGFKWDDLNKQYSYQHDDAYGDLVMAIFVDQRERDTDKLNAEFLGFCLGWVARAKVDVGICEAHIGGDVLVSQVVAKIAAAIKQDVQE